MKNNWETAMGMLNDAQLAEVLKFVMKPVEMINDVPYVKFSEATECIAGVVLNQTCEVKK